MTFQQANLIHGNNNIQLAMDAKTFNQRIEYCKNAIRVSDGASEIVITVSEIAQGLFRNYFAKESTMPEPARSAILLNLESLLTLIDGYLTVTTTTK
jgi:hypothetical protein